MRSDEGFQMYHQIGFIFTSVVTKRNILRGFIITKVNKNNRDNPNYKLLFKC